MGESATNPVSKVVISSTNVRGCSRDTVEELPDLRMSRGGGKVEPLGYKNLDLGTPVG